MKKGERRKRSVLVKCRIDQVRRWKGERTRLERVDGMFSVWSGLSRRCLEEQPRGRGLHC